MRVTFLGTGTSHGVPMIGCNCSVCTSSDPKNTRSRCSVFVQENEQNILIDTPPELRLQIIREGISSVDAVLFTHAHADHLFGLDDVRQFNDLSGHPMPCYGSAETLDSIKHCFGYAFRPAQKGGGKPSLELIPIDSAFEIGSVRIIPIPVLHGRLHVLGYRIRDFAYITDCNFIPKSSMEMLTGLDTLVLGVIRHNPHETHFSVPEGLNVVDILKPKRAYFTHVTHKLDHTPTNEILPFNVELAYDGLSIEL